MGNSWVSKQIWTTELLKILQTTPEIEKVTVHTNYYKLKFRNTQVVERWALTEEAFQRPSTQPILRIPDNPFAGVNRKLQIYRMFETDVTQPEEFELLKEHFVIPKKEIKTSNFINLRISVHRLIETLGKQGWVHPTYTNDVLQTDLNELIAERYQKYQLSLIRYVTARRRRFRGRRLIYNFHEFPKLVTDHWSIPRTMRVIVDRILTANKPLSRETMIDSLYSYIAPPAMISPNYYRAIMTQWFDPKSTILDLTPSASKAIGATLCDHKYFAIKPNPSIAQTLQFMGHSGAINPIYPKYDYVILSMDRIAKNSNAQALIVRYGKMGKFITVVPKSELESYKLRFNVVRVLRIAITTAYPADDDDYLLIIDQK